MLLHNRRALKAPESWVIMNCEADDDCPSHQNERHTYEKCQYEEFKKRVAKMDELRAAKGGAKGN
jgi:hypothetical protein